MPEYGIAAAVFAALDWYGDLRVGWILALTFAVGIAGGWTGNSWRSYALWLGYAAAMILYGLVVDVDSQPAISRTLADGGELHNMILGLLTFAATIALAQIATRWLWRWARRQLE